MRRFVATYKYVFATPAYYGVNSPDSGLDPRPLKLLIGKRRKPPYFLGFLGIAIIGDWVEGVTRHIAT